MATVFDRAAYLATVDRPVFYDGVREYVGRVLSAEEWFRIEADLAAAGALDGPGVLRMMRRLTDTIFPRPWWQVWRPKVSTLLLALPLPAQIACFESFVEALATIHRTTSPGPTPAQHPAQHPTSGTDSPP